MTDDRLREIAENAVSFLYDAGLLDEFLEDRYIDFDADDYAYFGFDDEWIRFKLDNDEDDDEDWDDFDWNDEDDLPDEDDESDEPTDEPVSEPTEKPMEEIKEYFNNCVDFWKRQGDPASIAVCKALWWDCADIWNFGKSWTPNKVKFFNEYRHYEPYGQLPEARAVEEGKA